MVIRAFVAAIMAVRTSDTRNITQKIPGMVPFQFDEETAQGPCSFEFYFVARMEFPTAMGLQLMQTAYMRSTCITMPVPALPCFRADREKFMYNQTDESSFSKYGEEHA